MKFHKRQLILASLVVALGAAVYLNWQFSDTHEFDAPDAIETAHELGEARYVNTSNVSDTPDNIIPPGSPSSQTSSQTKKFFAEASSNRQKAHDQATEKLKSLIDSQNVDEEIKKEILKQSDELTKNIERESNIENLIKAKGFGDCIASIQNDECSIIVSPGNLKENTAIVIRDIVTGQSGITSDKIKITEAK